METVPLNVKEYVDERIGDAIEQRDASHLKGKKWRNSWRSASPITKASFIITCAIAFATIVYASAAVWQLIEMRKIADESAGQTQQLVDAATQIKGAGWTFSGAAQGINNATWSAVGRLQSQVDQIKRSADAASSAATTAHDALYWEQRPWVGVEITQTMTPHEAADATVSFHLIAKNTGRTPALYWKMVCFETAYFPEAQTQKAIPDCDGQHRLSEQRRLNLLIEQRKRIDPGISDEEISQIELDFRKHSEEQDALIAESEGAGQTIVPTGYREIHIIKGRREDIVQFEYTLGRITYRDAINPLKEHVTNFCVMRFGDNPFQLCEFGQDMN
jgi:ElaB/YqjD/DUF883 family membrane-anchored ribosome-binding protein